MILRWHILGYFLEDFFLTLYTEPMVYFHDTLFFSSLFSVSIRIQSYLLSLSCFSSWQILLTHQLGDVVCLLEYMFASFPFLSKMTSFISFSIISLSVLMKICYIIWFVTI